MNREDEIREWLKGRITTHRYRHTIAVYEAVEELAGFYGVESAPLQLAALLHDCARELPPDRLLELSEGWGLPVRKVDRQSPVLLHGKVAAVIARREWGLAGEAMRTAIIYHTAGHPEMSLSDKIFFLSDHISPDRGYEGVVRLREAACRDIDDAMLMAIGINLRHLGSVGAVIDPDTLALKQLLIGEQEKKRAE